MAEEIDRSLVTGRKLDVRLIAHKSPYCPNSNENPVWKLVKKHPTSVEAKERETRTNQHFVIVDDNVLVVTRSAEELTPENAPSVPKNRFDEIKDAAKDGLFLKTTVVTGRPDLIKLYSDVFSDAWARLRAVNEPDEPVDYTNDMKVQEDRLRSLPDGDVLFEAAAAG